MYAMAWNHDINRIGKGSAYIRRFSVAVALHARSHVSGAATDAGSGIWVNLLADRHEQGAQCFVHRFGVHRGLPLLVGETHLPASVCMPAGEFGRSYAHAA